MKWVVQVFLRNLPPLQFRVASREEGLTYLKQLCGINPGPGLSVISSDGAYMGVAMVDEEAGEAPPSLPIQSIIDGLQKRREDRGNLA